MNSSGFVQGQVSRHSRNLDEIVEMIMSIDARLQNISTDFNNVITGDGAGIGAVFHEVMTEEGDTSTLLKNALGELRKRHANTHIHHGPTLALLIRQCAVSTYLYQIWLTESFTTIDLKSMFRSQISSSIKPLPFILITFVMK